MSTRDAILEQVRTVPSLPASAIQALHIAQDDNASIGELQKVIEHDPALASNLLRMANSAYYRGHGEIATVRDAVVRLGTKTILDLILGSAIAPVARRPVSGYDLPANALLRHAIAVAIGADRLGGHGGGQVPPYTYTAGLLHDLGKVVLGSFLEIDGAAIRRLAFDEGLSFEQAEQDILGIDHAEVGAILLSEWNVPEPIVAAVRWHHEPERNKTGDQRAVDLVHIANIVVLSGGLGMGSEGLNYAVSHDALQRLAMTTAIAEAVIGTVVFDLTEVENLLQGVEGGPFEWH